MAKKRLEKAEKEVKEAQDAVYEAACSCCEGEEKENLLRAERDLEKAEAEVEDAEERE